MQGYVTIETSEGLLRGFEHAGITSFLGVPYAAPPVGPLRFRLPQEPAPWTGTRDAISFASAAMQPDTRCDAHTPERMAIMKLMYPKGGHPLEGYPMSEDCLYLNVWTPGVNDGVKRPVMVWLHGGGFVQGSGSIGMYEGDHLAELADVVVVTLNHRLGVFGFMPSDTSDGEAFLGSVNAGMEDIAVALRWVQRNIAACGGDPDNVTLFGQSGGGVKASMLMAMPSAQGLFHKVIAMSGPGLRAGEVDQAAALRQRLLGSAGVTSLAELQDLPAEAVLDAANRLASGDNGPFAVNPKPRRGEMGLMMFRPVLDGHVLPHHPFDPAPPAAADAVPMLIGFCTHDPSFLLIDDPDYRDLTEQGLAKYFARVMPDRAEELLAQYRAIAPTETPQLRLSRFLSHAMFGSGSIAIADRKSQQSAPVFAYEFAYGANMYPGLLGASHSMDLPFAFYNVDRSPFSGTDPERLEVSRRMALAWASFARFGSPSHSDIPYWPQYDPDGRATMVIDTDWRLKQGPRLQDLTSFGLGL